MQIPKHILKRQGGWWEALAAAAISAVGSYLSNRKKNKDEAAAAREANAFNADQTATSYTRAVQDMKNAGLNPMLAYQQGGAASAVANKANVVDEAGSAIGTGVSSASQAIGMLQGVQQIKNGEVSNEQVIAQTEKIKSETMEKNLNTARLAAQIDETKANEANLKIQAANTSEAVLGTRYDSSAKQMAYRANQGDDAMRNTGWAADVRRRKAEAKGAEYELSEKKATSDFYKGIGQLNPHLKGVLEILKGASSVKQMIGGRK